MSLRLIQILSEPIFKSSLDKDGIKEEHGCEKKKFFQGLIISDENELNFIKILATFFIHLIFSFC